MGMMLWGSILRAPDLLEGRWAGEGLSGFCRLAGCGTWGSEAGFPSPKLARLSGKGLKTGQYPQKAVDIALRLLGEQIYLDRLKWEIRSFHGEPNACLETPSPAYPILGGA